MRFTIPRYPVHLIDVLYVADGRRLTVRPVLPQDAQLQSSFVRSLSDGARYARFMTRLAELPDVLVERFSQIDYRSHLALLAEAFDDGCQVMVAEARYVVDAADATRCEFALSIADGWQGLGIARSLLERLEREAARSGLRTMTADALMTNAAMIGLARRSGYAVKINRQDGRLVRLEKSLAPPLTPAVAA